jgi:hypothetical protein
LLILKLKPQGNVTSADVSSSQSTCNPSLALVNNPLWFTRLSAGTRLIYFIAFSNAAMVIDRHQQSIESSARGSFEHLVNRQIVRFTKLKPALETGLSLPEPES